MRTVVALLSVVLLLALGAVALLLIGGPSERAVETSAALGPSAQISTVPGTGSTSEASERARENGEILARMDALAQAVEDLEKQVAELKAGAAREPVAQVPPGEAVDEAASTFAALHREAILQVIEADRQAQQRKREEEQQGRELQSALARAERTAQRFGLAADQQRALADVYLLERQKIEDLRTQMRDQGLAGDPETFRDSFRAMREWRMSELTTRLGADLAQKINDSDIERFRGGGRRPERAEGDGGGAPDDRLR